MGLLIPVFLFLIFPDLGLAPPLPTRQTEAPASSLIEPSTNTAPSSTSEPPSAVEAKEDEEVRKPVVEKVRRATLPAALTPARHGHTEGPLWIGQRTLVEDYVGWGWIRRESEGWNQARWIAIEYDSEVCPVPHAFLPRPGDDKDYLYKLYGDFAPYRAYEPQADVWIDVFLIKGFVSLGPAKNEIRRDPPHHGSAKPNRFAERGANLR